MNMEDRREDTVDQKNITDVEVNDVGKSRKNENRK